MCRTQEFLRPSAALLGRREAAGGLRRAVKAEKLFNFPFPHKELRRTAGGRSLTPDSALTLEGRSARSVSLGGLKGLLLLASHHCFPQRPKRDWGKRFYSSRQLLIFVVNPLNPELNPICYLLALLGAHHFLHVSRIRVKLLTFRLLMSYIWSTHS